MKLVTRTRGTALSDRLTWQAASLLLAYPDEQRTARLDTVEELLSHVGGSAAKLLRATAASLRAGDSIQAEIDYVETFDLRRRCTMYLTYWTAGDTRNRGAAMLEFATSVSRGKCRAAERRGARPPAGGAGVRRDRRPGGWAAAARRTPGADRRAA